MRRALLALAFAVTSLPAAAGADAVDFQIFPKVLTTSGERPRITLSANDVADDVVIRLQRDDGKVFNYRSGKLRPGQTKTFNLDVQKGPERRFKGSLTVKIGVETRTAEFEFDAEIFPPAEIGLDKSKVDLAARTMELNSTRETSKVEIAVTSDQGKDLGVTETPFENAPPGTPLKVSWNQAEGTVMKIAIRVHDADGFYSGVELYPWRIDIPHEEVNFATGSFKVELGEEFKLAKSLELIRDSVERYGQFADLKLFIAGHTDTVGAADSNRALSLNRARAISEYLRRKGVRIPVFYEGFGEDALAVSTPDETDEPRNRRAEYILAIEPPSIRGGAERWKPLK